MRKNVIDDSIYMVKRQSLNKIRFQEESVEQEKIDNILNAHSKYQMQNRKVIPEFAIKSSEETDLIIEELRKIKDEDAYITTEEIARAYIHSIKNNNISEFLLFQVMQDNIRRLIKLGVSGKIVELKKIYSYMEDRVFDYIKEFGHYSFEDDVDERVESDKEILLYENGSFKEVTIETKSLKLSN